MTALSILAPLLIVAAPCRSTDLTPEQLDERLAAAEKIVADNETNMAIWYGATYGVHSAVLLGSLVIANTGVEDAVRDGYYVAAVGSVLGLITLMLAEPPLIGAGEAVAGVEDKTKRLAMLEAILQRTYEKNNRTQGWLSHTISALYSLGASAFIWFVVERKRTAVTQFIGGNLIGQGRILLQPDGAKDGWAQYRSEYLANCGEEVAEAPAVEVVPTGLGFQVRF